MNFSFFSTFSSQHERVLIEYFVLYFSFTESSHNQTLVANAARISKIIGRTDLVVGCTAAFSRCLPPLFINIWNLIQRNGRYDRELPFLTGYFYDLHKSPSFELTLLNVMIVSTGVVFIQACIFDFTIVNKLWRKNCFQRLSSTACFSPHASSCQFILKFWTSLLMATNKSLLNDIRNFWTCQRSWAISTSPSYSSSSWHQLCYSAWLLFSLWSQKGFSTSGLFTWLLSPFLYWFSYLFTVMEDS